MPRGGIRDAKKKGAKGKKTIRSPAKKSDPTSEEINVSLINVLRGGISGDSLDDSTSEWQQFKPSGRPSRKAHGKVQCATSSDKSVQRVPLRVSGRTAKRAASPVKRTPKKARKNVLVEDDIVEEQGLLSQWKDLSSESKTGRGRDDDKLVGSGTHVKNVKEKSDRKVEVRSPRGKGRQNNLKNEAAEEKAEKKSNDVTKGKLQSTGTVTRPSPVRRDSKQSTVATEEGSVGRGLSQKSLREGHLEASSGRRLNEDGKGATELVCPCCGRGEAEIFPDGVGDMNDHALMCLKKAREDVLVEDDNVEEDLSSGSKTGRNRDDDKLVGPVTRVENVEKEGDKRLRSPRGKSRRNDLRNEEAARREEKKSNDVTNGKLQLAGTVTRPSPVKRDNEQSTVAAEEGSVGRGLSRVSPRGGHLEAFPGRRLNDDEDEKGAAELVCPCCGRGEAEIFPDGVGDMNDHALMCLHQRFNRDAIGDEANTGKPGGDSDEQVKEMVKENGEPIVCQICKKDISHMTGVRREQHVNRCIDISSSQNPAESTTDEDDDEIVCQICTKNLSHLNSRRRMQHVNRCIDSNPEVTSGPTSVKQVTSGPALDRQEEDGPKGPPAKPAPKCIICGIVLNTYQKKKNHLKSCALKNNITTIQLLDMIRKQESPANVNGTGETGPGNGAGNSESAAATATKNKPVPRRRGKPGKRKKKEDLDENVQVAMALSASVAEQEDKERLALGLPPLVPPTEENPTDQSEKGIKTKRKRRRKRKEHAMKFAPLLTRSSPENRKIWAEKVASIVESTSQGRTGRQKTPESRGSRLAARHSKKVAEAQTNRLEADEQASLNGAAKPMWSLTHSDATSGTTAFYVGNLKPYVSPEKKKNARKKSLRFDLGPEAPKDSETPAATNPPCNNVSLGPMTQDAINDLMGLANEDSQDESMEERSEPLTCGFIPRNEEKRVPGTSQSQQALLDSLRDMVDSPDLEPLRILAEDDQYLHVHHFILKLRCPKLLEDHGITRSHGNQEIRLIDFSKSTLLAVMRYLYAGDDDFPESSIMQIEKFAHRFQLEELETICKSKSRSDAAFREPGSPDKSGDTSYQKLIQSIWDDGSEEDSFSQREEDTTDASQEVLPNLFDMADIYEHALSQRTGGGPPVRRSERQSADKKGTGNSSEASIGSGKDGGGLLNGVSTGGQPGKIKESTRSSSEDTVILSGDDSGSNHNGENIAGEPRDDGDWMMNGDTDEGHGRNAMNVDVEMMHQSLSEEKVVQGSEERDGASIGADRDPLASPAQKHEGTNFATSQGSSSREPSKDTDHQSLRVSRTRTEASSMRSREPSKDTDHQSLRVSRTRTEASSMRSREPSKDTDHQSLRVSRTRTEASSMRSREMERMSGPESAPEQGQDSTLQLVSEDIDEDYDEGLMALSDEEDAPRDLKGQGGAASIPPSVDGEGRAEESTIPHTERNTNVDVHMESDGEGTFSPASPAGRDHDIHQDNSPSPVVGQGVERGRVSPRGSIAGVEEADSISCSSPLSSPVSGPTQEQPVVPHGVGSEEGKDGVPSGVTGGLGESQVLTPHNKGRPRKETSSEKKACKSYSLRNWIIGGTPLSPRVHQRNVSQVNTDSLGDGADTGASSSVPAKRKRERLHKSDKNDSNDIVVKTSQTIMSQEEEEVTIESTEIILADGGSDTVRDDRELIGESTTPLSRKEQPKSDVGGTGDLRGYRDKDSMQDITEASDLGSNNGEDRVQSMDDQTVNKVDDGIPAHLLVERRWSLRVTSQESKKGNTTSETNEQTQKSGETASPPASPTPGRKGKWTGKSTKSRKSSPPSEKRSGGSASRVGRTGQGTRHFTKFATKKRGFKFKRKLLRGEGKGKNSPIRGKDRNDNETLPDPESPVRETEEKSSSSDDKGKQSEPAEEITTGVTPAGETQTRDTQESDDESGIDSVGDTSEGDLMDRSIALFDKDDEDGIPEGQASEQDSTMKDVDHLSSSKTLDSQTEGEGERIPVPSPINDLDMSRDKAPSLKVNLGRKFNTLHFRSMNMIDLRELMDGSPCGDGPESGERRSSHGKENIPNGRSTTLEREGYGQSDDGDGIPSSPPLELPSPGTSPSAPCHDQYVAASPMFDTAVPSLNRVRAPSSNFIEIANVETGEIHEVQEIGHNDPTLEDMAHIGLQDELGASPILPNFRSSPRHRLTNGKSPRSQSPAARLGGLDVRVRNNSSLIPGSRTSTPSLDSTRSRQKKAKRHMGVPGISHLETLEKIGICPRNGTVTVGVATGVLGVDPSARTNVREAAPPQGMPVAEENDLATTDLNETGEEADNTELFAFDMDEGDLEGADSFEVAHRVDDAGISPTEGKEFTSPMDQECGVVSSRSLPVGGAVVLEEIDLTDDGGHIDLTEDEEEPVSNPKTKYDRATAATEEVIPGCSHSFMEDLASAPSDEQFWSNQELGVQAGTGVDHNPPPLTSGGSFKTPSQIIRVRSITYEEFHSPTPITPMPPYDEMVTPELAEELNRFGVKKLRRKPARLKLKEIYQFTHQVQPEDGSSGEAGASKKSPKKSKKSKESKKKKSPKKKRDRPDKDTEEGKRKSPKKKKKKHKSDKEESPTGGTDSPIFAEPQRLTKKRGHSGKTGQHTLDSQERTAGTLSPEKLDGGTRPADISSSQSSEIDEGDDFGESILYEAEEEISSSQQSSHPEESIFEYIKSNQRFYESCLQYQPFDLDDFQKELKAHKIKVSKPSLMNILDAMCLTFRSNSGRRRKSPKKSPKKKKKAADT